MRENKKRGAPYGGRETGALLPLFAVTLILTLLSPVLFRVRFALPLLVAAQYALPLDRALWTAFGVGLLLDLLCDGPFGLSALTLCIAVALLYPLRKRLYRDHATTLPLLTALLSATSTLLLFMLRAALGDPLPLTPLSLITDVILLPLGDALFAYLLAFGIKRLGRTPTVRRFAAKRPS